jgi:predicted nucleic acid-binding protein
VTVYLDTSSVIKLYVLEDGSEVVRKLVASASIVSTSVVTYAETRAALARLRREGALTAAKLTSAKRQLDAQWPSFVSILATNGLCLAAGDFAERYAFRGFDSIHLASFAEVASRAGPRQTRFSSFDDRLNEAARKLTRRLRKRRR